MSAYTNKTLGGYVYVAESTRPNGAVHVYTGMTRRSPFVRWGEHMRGAGGKYTSQGTWFKPLGAVWSSNPRKAEKTIKRMSPNQKRAFGYAAARNYRNNGGCHYFSPLFLRYQRSQ